LLGREPVAQSEGVALFQVGDTRIFIHANYTPGEGDLSAEDHFAFDVEDVDSACASLQEQGLVLEVAPRSFYWGRSAYLRDPDGHLIELSAARGEGSGDQTD
jgi:catechol 2,3-dioxygenase-like lactoylglutathione lyase family enzyme